VLHTITLSVEPALEQNCPTQQEAEVKNQ